MRGTGLRAHQEMCPEFESQATGERPRDKFRLIVATLALTVRMQRDGNHCVGLKFLSCVSNHLGEAIGKPVPESVTSSYFKSTIAPANASL